MSFTFTCSMLEWCKTILQSKLQVYEGAQMRY